MLKDLINNEMNELPFFGASVYRIKKYIAKTSVNDYFDLHFPAMLLIKSGSFKMQVGERLLDMKPYDLIMLTEQLVCTAMEPGDKLQFFLVAFSSDKKGPGFKYAKMDFLFYLAGKQAVKIGLQHNDYMVLYLICRLLYTASHYSHGSDFEYELKRVSSDLLFFELKYIFSKYVTSSGLHVSKAEALALQFLNVLSIHCRKHHTVKFYAGALYVTPEYLNRAMKQAVGKPAKNMITEAVLAEAIQLLEDPAYSITEIAEELEFGSPSSFNIFFKKGMSCTPSEFRSHAAERFKSR